jgi:hypothetical protein
MFAPTAARWVPRWPRDSPWVCSEASGVSRERVQTEAMLDPLAPKSAVVHERTPAHYCKAVALHLVPNVPIPPKKLRFY